MVKDNFIYAKVGYMEATLNGQITTKNKTLIMAGVGSEVMLKGEWLSSKKVPEYCDPEKSISAVVQKGALVNVVFEGKIMTH